MNDIEARLKKVLKTMDVEDVDGIDLKEDLTKLNINSINFVKLVVGIESEFDFEFDDNDLTIDKFKNLESIIAYIRENTEG